MSIAMQDRPMADQAQSDQSSSALLFRVSILESQIKQLQDQLKNYVPARENELQLQNIQSTTSRIERDVIDIKARLETAEKEGRKRDDEQREAQDKLQIRTLWFIVSTVVTIVVLIFTGYVTHFFH